MPRTRKTEDATLVPIRPGADQIPEHVLKSKGQGRGVSKAAEDNLIPMVAVIQPLSPQLNKLNPSKYLEDAEPGSIWIRGMQPEIVSDFIFQPCHFHKSIVEWIPRSKGGGFVGRHLTWPEGMITGKSDDGRRNIMLTRDGNHLIETRYHVGHIITPDGSLRPYIIPFSSTGHTVSRGWMNLMSAINLPGGGTPDSWTRLYRLTTVQRTNQSGMWYVFNPQPHGWATPEQCMAGENLFNSFERGEKKLGDEDETGEADLAGGASGGF